MAAQESLFLNIAVLPSKEVTSLALNNLTQIIPKTLTTKLLASIL